MRWTEIYDLNRDVLGEDFDYLRPGTNVVLPPHRHSDDWSPAARPEHAAVTLVVVRDCRLGCAIALAHLTGFIDSCAGKNLQRRANPGRSSAPGGDRRRVAHGGWCPRGPKPGRAHRRAFRG